MPSINARSVLGGSDQQTDLPIEEHGVLASQQIRQLVNSRGITAEPYSIPEQNIQPASLDLRLGDVAYRIRCSFLPAGLPVRAKLSALMVDEIDIRKDGAVLETNRPYLIPLQEQLSLPRGIRGKANPKSSTGRIDVFTRLIVDHGHKFDEVPDGYSGPLYLEVVPLSFTVRVREALSLNQLRFQSGDTGIADEDIRHRHEEDPLLYRKGHPVGPQSLTINEGVFLGLDLESQQGRVGYRARDYTTLLDMDKTGLDVEAYWEEVYSEDEGRLVLAPERFYLLMSEDAIRIPPGLAGEMTAFDPTSGELRTHYAGFFDPGFGYDPVGGLSGSRAALEVRAHDVPFLIEHRQRLCRITFERMAAEPDVLYGVEAGSSYQGQNDVLGKHFNEGLGIRRDRRGQREGATHRHHPSLFDRGERYED